MFRTALLAALALACLIANAEARPRSGPWQSCVPASDVMRPCAYQSNFLAGVKSIKVRMHRVEKTRISNLSGRPAGCPHAWCGCWLAAHLGLSDRSLWLARKWALIGRPAPGPQVGAIVVWRHHVGQVMAVESGKILVLSGNDGHAVRERWRATSGVIAYRIAGL